MRSRRFVTGLAAWMLAAAAPVLAITLKEAYQAAPAANGYDRYVVLQPGVVYDGGLLIGATWDDDLQVIRTGELGADTRIVGNGAILDLHGQQICISFCRQRLDIEDCVILGGNIRFRGEHFPGDDRVPRGSVRYCTFYQPHDYAVRLQGAGDGVVVERTIVVDCVDTGVDYGIWSSLAAEHLPTGVCFGPSVQVGAFGLPELRDNWSYSRDPVRNADPLYHYAFL